jgi:hypothetical protein
MTVYDDRPDDERYTADADASTTPSQQRQRQQSELHWLLWATALSGAVMSVGAYVWSPSLGAGAVPGVMLMIGNLWALAIGVGAALSGRKSQMLTPIVTAMMASIAVVFVIANRWPATIAGVGIGLCSPALGGLLMGPLRKWWSS